MPGSRLANAVSPYLRSHAGNPVDWFPWGAAAFESARERDVPVLVSIGYSTCHWCHVMARESFSDAALAARLNAGFVAVKVDREEHPEVDETYMAAASAFTPHLGWPLNVFVTPEGRAFFAGTYSPPTPIQGHPSFGQVLDAVEDAWRNRRAEVERSAAGLVEALRDTAAGAGVAVGGLDGAALAAAVDGLLAAEEPVHGGFGPGPKFPVAPALAFGLAAARSPLLDDDRRVRARAAVRRALDAMAARGLRDPVEGGFFRYATRADWSEPHYERMLTDNALLLPVYADVGDVEVVDGIVRFLDRVLRQGEGAFGSAQDSESVVAGRRTEGGWYALDAAARARETAPSVDGKELTGWNGMAVGGLADAGARSGETAVVELARSVAEVLLARRRADGSLVRAVLGGAVSDAAATLEDVGGLADGLMRLAIASGEVRYAAAARELVDAALAAGAGGFAVPGGGDPLLADLGVGVGAGHTSEGATPSGTSSIAAAAWRLHLLTGEARYAAASRAAIAPLLTDAVRQPTGFGAVLELATAHASPVRQTVVVGDPASPLAAAARLRRDAVVAIVTEEQAAAFAAAGFDLFAGRTGRGGTLAHLCDDFVCALPTADPAAVAP